MLGEGGRQLVAAQVGLLAGDLPAVGRAQDELLAVEVDGFEVGLDAAGLVAARPA